MESRYLKIYLIKHKYIVTNGKPARMFMFYVHSYVKEVCNKGVPLASEPSTDSTYIISAVTYL